MSDDEKCFLCGSECEIYPAPLMHTVKDYRCKYCGPYLIDHAFIDRYPHINDAENKFKIACILNERRLKGLSGVALSYKTKGEVEDFRYPIISVDDILDEFPKKASDFLNRTLLNLSQLVGSKHPFEKVRLELATKKDYLHLFSRSTEAGFTFLQELANQEYIRFNRVRGVEQRHVFCLTAKFWEKVENLQQKAIDSKRVFVAMWFNESMDDYYRNGIKKAVEETGYVPVRIDLKDFNDKICDEIVAEIRQAKFMIADCSKYRTAVFFEAGFAKGLGREVIFTVKKEDVEELKEHFDTRQYNHIVYDSSEDLRKKLYNRIGATIV